VSKAERSRREANKCAELAKSASRALLGKIYQKIAVRYVFMAEELLRGPERDVAAVGRADQLTSRLRLDGGSDALFYTKRSGGCPATRPSLTISDAANHGPRGARRTPHRRPG
jgi:hypothetical protein